MDSTDNVRQAIAEPNDALVIERNQAITLRTASMSEIAMLCQPVPCSHHSQSPASPQVAAYMDFGALVSILGHVTSWSCPVF